MKSVLFWLTLFVYYILPEQKPIVIAQDERRHNPKFCFDFKKILEIII